MVLSNRDASEIIGMIERLIERKKLSLSFDSIDAICECGHDNIDCDETGCRERDESIDMHCGCSKFKISGILLGVSEKE